MTDFPMQQGPTRKTNYWCDQEGKMVYKCNNGEQCFECALVQSREEQLNKD